MAEVHNELADLEPSIADDHRARAPQEHELAAEIGAHNTGVPATGR
jgi:hypothetical protein